MLAYSILGGIVVSALAFALWLVTFLLNRGLNTDLETAAEGRRGTTRQLCYGAAILGVVILLSVLYEQTSHEPVLPPLQAGLSVAQPADAPAPPTAAAAEKSAEHASLVFVGIFASALAFIIWLGMYLLSQSINTAFVSGPESRRRTSRQLALGACLLSITVALTIVFFQMDRSAIVPDLDAPAPIATTQGETPESEAEPADGATETPEEMPDTTPDSPAETNDSSPDGEAPLEPGQTTAV